MIDFIEKSLVTGLSELVKTVKTMRSHKIIDRFDFIEIFIRFPCKISGKIIFR